WWVAVGAHPPAPAQLVVIQRLRPLRFPPMLVGLGRLYSRTATTPQAIFWWSRQISLSSRITHISRQLVTRLCLPALLIRAATVQWMVSHLAGLVTISRWAAVQTSSLTRLI